MRSIILFLSVVYLFSCKNEIVYDNSGSQETRFVSNFPKVITSYTLDLKYDGDLVTATRTHGPIQPEAISNGLFIQADVNFKSDGSFDLKGQTDIWFIPFNAGTPVENLGITKCLIYYCSCGGSPVTSPSGCVIDETPTRVSCENASNGCEGTCLGWSQTVDCPTGQMIDGSPGGVIVKAKRVNVIEPEWYDTSKKQLPVVFTVAEDDRIIKH